ncbi:MAG: hypothetical protein EXS24_06960 [Pedosphaera sp.]|nr:hypothetical protein [Pedosphaera sp.]
MKYQIMSVFCVGALALGLAACTGVSTSSVGYNQQNGRPKFVTLDPLTKEAITSPGIQETVLPDGRLMVKANVRNRLNKRVHVQINCVFHDAQGFKVDETPYETLILTENGQETVSFTSLREGVKDYVVQIRQVR